MSGGFVKIYGGKLLRSSLWLESAEVRVLFLGMLAEAGADGVVDIPSTKVLAHRMNLTLEQTERALAVLEAPDDGSRTPDDDGRRVRRVGAAWHVVNYQNYRELQTERQLADAKRQVSKREADKLRTRADADGRVHDTTDASVTLRTNPPEAKAEAEAEKSERARAPVREAQLPERPKHEQLRSAVRVEFAKRFQEAEGSLWTRATDPAADTLAAWLSSLPGDPLAALQTALDNYFADPWVRSQHFPVQHLAKYPQKYLAPRPAPSATSTADPAERKAELGARLNDLQSRKLFAGLDGKDTTRLDTQIETVMAEMRQMKRG